MNKIFNRAFLSSYTLRFKPSFLALIRPLYRLAAAFLLIASFILSSCGTKAPEQVSINHSKALTRDAVIRQYFSGHTLDTVEGIWISDNQAYEIAFVRNTTGSYPNSKYVGIVINSKNENWPSGSIKMIMNPTSEPQVLTGTYFDAINVDQPISLVRTGNNVLSTRIFPTTRTLLGNTIINRNQIIRIAFIRNYPSGQVKDGGGNEQQEDGSKKRGGGSGSGFFIAHGIVATNEHVVSETEKVLIYAQKKRYNGKVLVRDRNNDVALIEVIGIGDHACFAGGMTSFGSGERIYALGFPLSSYLGDQELRITDGLINATTGIRNDPTYYSISTPIQPGNSGGPVVDERAQLVGLASSGLKSFINDGTRVIVPQNVNFAVKRAYLDLIAQGQKLTPCASPIYPAAKPLESKQLYDTVAPAVVYIVDQGD